MPDQQPVQAVIYGYIRLARRNLARRIGLLVELCVHCEQHGLALATVFTEYGDARTERPAAFVGLLDVLALAGTHGVIISAGSHLGRGEVAAARRRSIARTGAQLLIVHSPQRARSEQPQRQES